MINENLPHLYRSADLFILPSKFDTFGIVVIEALASGLPVIVSDTVGAHSLSPKTKTVRLYKVKNGDDLAKCSEETISLIKEAWVEEVADNIPYYYSS